MLPTEEACFRAVLRACQDHADAMLACGSPPRPTALMAQLEHGRITGTALARMDMLDEASVVRFVQLGLVRVVLQRLEGHAVALDVQRAGHFRP